MSFFATLFPKAVRKKVNGPVSAKLWYGRFEMPDSFPQRHGLAGPPPGTLLRNEVPPSFRTFLIDLPHAHVGVEIHEVHQATCDVLQVYPQDNLPPYFDYRQHIRKCDWFYIYAIIENLFTLVYGKDHYAAYPRRFVDAINKAFVAQNIGWQLNHHGKVVMRGDEAFENAANNAIDALWKDRPTAAGHLRQAIGALSARPQPNTSGAVSHATSAVECVLNDITGVEMTLGKYLDNHSQLFHPALKKALDGIYGYASDAGARHGREGKEPTFAEAQFAVTTCAGACTLLTVTNPKGKQ